MRLGDEVGVVVSQSDAIVSFRNLLVHQYWRVDAEIVWAIVTDDLPLLEAEVRLLLGRFGDG